MIEAIDQYHDNIRTEVFDIVPQEAGRVLDVGGGIGATGAELKRVGRAKSVVVVDQVNKAAPGIDQVFTGNLEDPALLASVVAEAGPFDTILCLDILEHLRDPWSLVAILANGLSANGTIVASIPNVNYVGLVGPLVLFGRYELQDAGILDRTHIRWFTRKTAVEMMTAPGLKLEVVDATMGRRYKLLNKLTLGLFRRFFVVQYLIRVRAAG